MTVFLFAACWSPRATVWAEEKSDDDQAQAATLAQLYKQPPEAKWLKARDFTIRDWMIAGSGCPKASLSAPGKNKIKLVADGEKGDVVTVELEQYELDGTKPINATRPNFARECTVRLAIYPRPGRKVAHVEADAAFAAQKGKSVEAALAARLVAGNDDIFVWEKKLPKGAPATLTERVHFQAVDAAKAQAVFSKIECEQPKLVGLDFTFVNFRDKLEDLINIKLTGRRATLRLRLAECKKVK